MSEYLDNIFTDDDLASNEFIDSINEEISDITGYQSSKKKDKEQDDKNKKDEDQIDPLLEVIKKEKVDVVEVTRTIVDDLSNEEKIKILRKPRNIASIAVDETGDIICKSWGNYYISGSKNSVDTAELINEYLDECKKPLSSRDFRRFIVGKKNVVEKFADMNFNKGKFDLSGFYENVV